MEENASLDKTNLVDLIVKNVLEITKVNQEFKEKIVPAAYIAFQQSTTSSTTRSTFGSSTTTRTTKTLRSSTTPSTTTTSTNTPSTTTHMDVTTTSATTVTTPGPDISEEVEERQMSERRRYTSKFRDFHDLQFYFPNVLSIFY